MRSKRTREELSLGVDGGSTMDDTIVREAVNLVALNEDPSTGSGTPPGGKRRQVDDSGDLLDRFSMTMVSHLQGSSNLEDAQSRARGVLLEFQDALHQDIVEVRQKADRHLAANKVLGRALHIMRDKLNEANQSTQASISELQRQVAAAEDRAKAAEQTVNLLRWHLQHEGGMGGRGGGLPPRPDVF